MVLLDDKAADAVVVDKVVSVLVAADDKEVTVIVTILHAPLLSAVDVSLVVEGPTSQEETLLVVILVESLDDADDADAVNVAESVLVAPIVPVLELGDAVLVLSPDDVDDDELVPPLSQLLTAVHSLFALPSGTLVAYHLACQMYPLYDTLLPPGYDFPFS